jgi:hypothetical protein
MGLVLAVVLGRLLGEAGSGVVMQAVGVFMIALGISRFGMDSSAIWLLPRLAMDAPTRVAPATWFMIAVSGTAGTVCAAVMIAASPLIAADDAAAEAIAASAWFLPVTSMLLTALAATRGLGGVAAYVWVGNVILPTLRPLAIIAVVALGGGAVAATVAWAAPETAIMNQVASATRVGASIARRGSSQIAEESIPKREMPSAIMNTPTACITTPEPASPSSLPSTTASTRPIPALVAEPRKLTALWRPSPAEPLALSLLGPVVGPLSRTPDVVIDDPATRALGVASSRQA